MVLDRRKVKHGTQDEIGYELGLVVPNEIANEFKKIRTGKKPIAGYGTQVAKKQYSINHFFQKYKIKLKEKYYPPEKISDYAKFIADNIVCLPIYSHMNDDTLEKICYALFRIWNSNGKK